MNMIMQMLMSQLQNKNPQGYQFINTAMQNGGDPNAILKQMLGNATPEQKQTLITQCKNYGVPNDILVKIQNMK